jgi:MoaA/NifB/PqqE/SkfB family radical SAM enzyme
MLLMRTPSARTARPGPPERRGRLGTWLAALVARRYLGRPELADVIAIRYRSPRAFLAGLVNEVAYRLGWSRSGPLLSANLELTNRCNLRCTFCPTGNGRLERPRGFMDERLFRRALAGAGPLEFVLLFQWGEPLLHPRFFELARLARSRGARTLVTTNATLLDERRVRRLLDAGLDRVTVSVDGDATTHEAVRGVPLSRTIAAIERLVAARDARRSETAIDVSMVVAPETEAGARDFAERFRGQVDRVQRIPLLTAGTRRTRCREPWRGGLVVLQDGRVTACCVDHEGALALGDANRESLQDIWNGPRMQALRSAHVGGDLPPVCARCTEYPTDAAAPRFSTPGEASRTRPATPERASARTRAPVGGR